MNRRTAGWILVGAQVALFVVLALLPWRTPSIASIVLAIPFVVLGGWLGVAAFHALGSAYVFGWGVSDKIKGVDYPHTYHRINDPMHFFIRPGITPSDLRAVRKALGIQRDGTIKN